MKKLKMILTSLLTVCMLFGSSVISVFAADGEYTYTATFYAGNQGTFSGIDGLSVVSTGTPVIDAQGDRVVVSGLKLGDKVSFDVQNGDVALGDSSKYYVKGVRISGRDNNSLETSGFYVNGDRDFVVAYGIQGDMVGYTVNYHDEEGNELAPSRTYYGNVGDKPVVAYLYVEGYTPQALALTKTLSSNEAQNVYFRIYTGNHRDHHRTRRDNNRHNRYTRNHHNRDNCCRDSGSRYSGRHNRNHRNRGNSRYRRHRR